MPDLEKLEKLFGRNGFTDYRWLNPEDIVVGQWVRMKCQFGCEEYGRTASCPPNTPSVAECERFFREYTRAAVFHFEKKVPQPEDRHAWSQGINLDLLKLEKDVFLAGYHKVFLLFMDSCSLCPECPGSRTSCKEPKLSRPGADALAMDVFATVRKVGYPIDVLADYDQVMNRYAFLLIE